MSGPGDLLFGVLASQLGFCTPDDVLAASRELVGREARSLADVLEQRGIITAAARRLVERLASRAARDLGGDAARPLELLPKSAVLRPRPTPDPLARLGEVAAVDEHPGRYTPVVDDSGAQVVIGTSRTGKLVLWNDSVLGREVAVKVDPPDEQALFAEARLTGHLDHPAVVPVYELGRRPTGEAYCAMQRVSGRTLTQAIAQTKTMADRLALLPAFLVACRCIAAAHEEGVVHCDLTSDHVMLGRFGEVYVVDWGMARRGETRSEERRVDLKCLGDVLAALVGAGSGQAPRDAPRELLAIARRTRLPPQEGGFESVDALVRELAAFVEGRRVASYRYSAAELLRRFVLRNRAFTAAAAALFVLLVVAGLVAQARVREERDQARRFAQRFLDDVASRLVAVPGVEKLVNEVTSAAVAHYERTTELERAPTEERRRVLVAMLRLADVALELGRRDDAVHALALARRLAQGLAGGQPSAEHLVLVSRTKLAEARLMALFGDPRRRALMEEALVEAERALAQDSSRVDANLAAAAANRELAQLEESSRREPRLRRSAEWGAKALAAAPGDVEAALSQARTLALLAFSAGGGFAPERHRLVEEALGLVRVSLEREPASEPAQQALVGLLVEAGAIAESEGEPARARALFEEAYEAGLEVLERRPGSLSTTPEVVRAEVHLGRYRDAWERLRLLEQQAALGPLAPVAPAIAFLAGDDDEAIRLARQPGIDGAPSALLFRALAAAMQGRPGDALIAARAARGRLEGVPWIRRAVYARAVTSGRLSQPGPRAVFDFALAWDGAVVDGPGRAAALERFITALEAELGR
ncbi:MAG: protein kinase [Myxococcota bacterium]